MTFDVEAERFDLTYNSDKTSPEAIITVIRNLGYDPTPVTASSTPNTVATSVAISELPKEFRALFEEAYRAKKPVLLDFTAPG